MIRSRRARYVHWGLVFLVYSAMQVYSASIKEAQEAADDMAEAISNEYNTSPNPRFEPTEDTSDSNESAPSTGSDYEASTTVPGPTTGVHKHRHTHPTYRPRRENCTPPAIEQFPRPLMPPWLRRHGGLVLHVLVAVFTFFGLAIVCDEYFVSSLDRICEGGYIIGNQYMIFLTKISINNSIILELRLSPDVAGATFMAAGSSAPELATVVIGVFFAKDDIGVSGVIGSAVFNIMFVISVCALCSGTVCHLNWWPLVRDCFFYSISILVMLIVIFNDYISWVWIMNIYKQFNTKFKLLQLFSMKP